MHELSEILHNPRQESQEEEATEAIPQCPLIKSRCNLKGPTQLGPATLANPWRLNSASAAAELWSLVLVGLADVDV